MTLKEYLETTRITQTDLARTVGVFRGTIHNIVTGRKAPSIELALKIQDATDGAVTVRDLLPTNHPALRLLSEKDQGSNRARPAMTSKSLGR